MTDSEIPVLEARGVGVGFGRIVKGIPSIRAVDDVELSVGRGEIVALAGESGCGKTSLARAMLGLQKPFQGKILHNGVPLNYTSRSLKAFRRKVQLVLQDPTGALNPRRTVYEAVSEGLRIHRVPGNERDLVAQALSLAGLRPAERFFNRFPHELSGGQRQRVVIAGALALKPDVIVADEPVSSLDASVRGEILALLLSLRDQLGLAVLVVTHDLGLAWNIADRLSVMYLGRIIETGATEEVLAAPSHPYTKALLSVLPESTHMQPIILHGEPPDPSNIPTGCRFNPRCPAIVDGTAQREGILGECVSTAIPVLPATGPHMAACLLHRGTGLRITSGAAEVTAV